MSRSCGAFWWPKTAELVCRQRVGTQDQSSNSSTTHGLHSFPSSYRKEIPASTEKSLCLRHHSNLLTDFKHLFAVLHKKILSNAAVHILYKGPH